MRRSFARFLATLAVLVPARAYAAAQDTQPTPPTSGTTTPTTPTTAPTAPTTAPPSSGSVTVSATPTTPPPADDDDSTMTIKASRNMDMQKFAESSQQELNIAGARTRYALNLFGDVQFGAVSRSEGTQRKAEPAFAVGVFDMLFTANLEKNFTMTSEFSATYEPGSALAELERLQLRWRPNKHFFFEAGRFHTDLGYWNVAYHHGRYLQLTSERPRMIRLHGGLLPVHWIGAQMGGTAYVGSGSISLIASLGNSREKLAATAGHGLHGTNLASINGVHSKIEAAGFLHRDLKFGVSGVYGTIPAETASGRPGLPGQSIDEKIANAFIALPSVPFYFLSEAYLIEHSLNSTALPENVGSKWRTIGAFALIGYQIGRFTPYIRGEYINSQVGAYIYDPFYFPESNSAAPFPVSLDVKEGVLGTRIDVSDWCSVKLEYQAMGGVGTRRPELPKPLIHTAIVNWSFGI